MTREELRNYAAVQIMAGARFTPDGASESFALTTPDRKMEFIEQGRYSVMLADALLAALAEPSAFDALVAERETPR